MHTRAQPSEYAKLLTDFFFSRPTTTSKAVINIRSAEKNKRSMILHLSSVFLALSTLQKKRRHHLPLPFLFMWTSRNTNIGIKSYIDKEKCVQQVPIFKVNDMHMRLDANTHLAMND
jgi:hypothetical protein